ncbi:MAG: hypothetical protein ACREPV_12615 [Lysobacter sp.]
MNARERHVQQTMMETDAESRYGIYRRHDRRNDLYGWNVGIGRDGRLVGSAYYSDLKYGGTEAALRAAQAHRDRILQQFPPTPRAVINQRLSARNTSGHPGVYFVRQKGKTIGCYAQTVMPGGKSQSRYFGFHTHGRDHAIALAVEERQRQLLQIDTVALRCPEAKAICPTSAVELTAEQLRPRRKHTGRKMLSTPALDPVSEAAVAAAILQRHGRCAPRQWGDETPRWIGRLQSPKYGTAGWRVLILKGGRRLAGRIFMDSRHGGAAQGFELAQRYRDEQLAALQLP